MPRTTKRQPGQTPTQKQVPRHPKTYFDVYKDAQVAQAKAAKYAKQANDLMIEAEKMRLFAMGLTG